ncbi:MAG: hypothetical protein HETSPECPRED_004117 [Heterodermia speciosa]|uniref:Uncharacterized protein n=1 Tax=Heterodermia speciosa TaxID=116794 RepID=A0A8H3F875_9LECA|nr:MAG: hypothetical protein HETSPECPRED_004117 [Heterodermia speciosa]
MLSNLLRPSHRPTQSTISPTHQFLLAPTPQQTSTFTTTSPTLAKGNRPRIDRRITLIRYHLHHPKTPRPLRFSRLRALRHWTIHRAAMLYRQQQRRTQELELERQYNAMRAACEELRIGVGDGGRLYRQAMVRKGIFGGKAQSEGGVLGGNGGVPIEYARAQTDGPPRKGWDEGWTRG